jgi:hypothetical protein
MDDAKTEAQEKEEIRLKIVSAYQNLEKPKEKVEDGWYVMNDPGEEFGGSWIVGKFTAAIKELADALDVKPWMFGASHSGADKGKLMFQFGVRDPNGREWTFSSQYRLATLEANENTQQTWQLKSTDDELADVGRFLANRLRRAVVTQRCDDLGSPIFSPVTFDPTPPESQEHITSE